MAFHTSEANQYDCQFAVQKLQRASHMLRQPQRQAKNSSSWQVQKISKVYCWSCLDNEDKQGAGQEADLYQGLTIVYICDCNAIGEIEQQCGM
jgi:hypothetical protein